MWSPEGNQRSQEFSVSSFGGSVPEVVKRSPPEADEAGGAAGVNAPVNEHDVYCGLLGMYPEFLQAYRTPMSYLICICLLGMTQGFVVNGLVSVVTPTIEKRFQLLGIESGLILSMFNVASCIMVMPVSYYGGVGHKPVIMGVGALVMATGSMVFCSPHFLAPPYLPSDLGATDICPERGPGKCAGASATYSIRSYKYYFMLGHALHGIGSSPFFTLGVAYLDQNTPSEKVSLYMGVFYATSILGPAMGFLLGAFFLSKFTDITVDSSELGISSTSNNWVGAWWLGFFGASIVTFFTGLPMSCFPRFLPTAQQREKDLSEIQRKKRQNSKKSLTVPVVAPSVEPAIAAPDGQVYFNPDPDHAHGSRRASVNLPPPATGATTEGQGPQTSRTNGALTPELSKRSLKNHIKRLSTNATFLCLTFAAAAEGMVAVPSACGGTVLGGYAITKFNMKSPTIVRYCAILALVPWFTMFAFLQSCPSRHSAIMNSTGASSV
nr:solute carrier organic anion transporter family member 4A1-like [Rhipicephalus microplus]